MEKYVRPSWDEYFFTIVKAVAKRATCDRGRTACILVKDHTILSTGYVGAPKGSPHCDDVGHLMKEITHEDGSKSRHCMRTAHAEANAIAQAAKNGVSVDGATAYCIMAPCRNCAMLFANSGIVRVVAEHHYHANPETEDILKNAGIEFCIMTDNAAPYEDK